MQVHHQSYSIEPTAATLKNPSRLTAGPTPVDVRAKIRGLSDADIDMIEEANLTMNGDLFRKERSCIHALVLILAAFFPFLILVVFARCYHQMVRDIFNVPEGAYKMLGRILSGKRIRRIRLKVKDNLFGQQKAQILYDMLRDKQLESFTFENGAFPFNFDQNEFANFQANIAPLTAMPNVPFLATWRDDIQICC